MNLYISDKHVLTEEKEDGIVKMDQLQQLGCSGG